MKYENYIEDRNNLLAQAEEVTDDNERFEAIMSEINTLDSKWDNHARNMANLNAMSSSKREVQPVNESVFFTEFENFTEDGEGDVTNSMEYRKAFMNYICKGKAIPRQLLNGNEVTKTTDVEVLIPTTVMERIVERIEKIGAIYNLVTKTNIKGGVKVPISSVKPKASWVGEGEGSDKQKKTVTFISFSYFKLRCAIAFTLEVDTMALSVFETTFVKQVSEAMVKAIEQAIIDGDGTTQPKGIFKEEPVEVSRTIEVEDFSYDTLVAAESEVDDAYDAEAVWLMNKKTFMKFIGMKDSNGEPIARVNQGFNGKPERVLLGRRVETTDYIKDFDKAANEDKFAAIVNMSDYILNTNLNLTLKQYEDNDTDDQIIKAVQLVDGKLVDMNSLVFLKKKSE